MKRRSLRSRASSFASPAPANRGDLARTATMRRAEWSLRARLARGLMLAALGAWLLFAGTVMVLRYAVLPGINEYREKIEQLAGDGLGLPIRIERVEAGWDGLRPELQLIGVQVFDGQGRAALSFREVNAVVAWRSVFFMAPIFHRLHAEGPELNAERNASGQVFIAGFPVSAGAASDPRLARWLLDQDEISISGATLFWRDALRQAPELRLDKFAFVLRNAAQSHVFGAVATPAGVLEVPQGGASTVESITLRGEFYERRRRPSEGPSDWRGRVYLAASDLDLAAWARWVEAPVGVARGRGSVRLWANLAGNALGEVVADVALSDVEAQVGRALDVGPGESLPTLNLVNASGRLSFHRAPPSAEGAGRATQLSGLDVSFALRDAQGELRTLRPTGFHVQWNELPEGGMQGLGIITEADLAELASIGAHLPIGDAVRDKLARYAPSGTLHNLQISWSGAAQGLQRYSVKSGFADLRMAANGLLPGFDGLSGTIAADDAGGTLHVDSGPLWLDFPAVFPGDVMAEQTDAWPAQVALDDLTLAAEWRVEDVPGAPGTVVAVRLKQAAFSGPDAQGEASGEYRFVLPAQGAAEDAQALSEAAPTAATTAAPGRWPGPLGDIDLVAHLADADATAVWRYLPEAVPAEVRHWLRGALRAGRASGVDLVLRGPLDAFPFADAGPFATSGTDVEAPPRPQFLVKARLEEGALNYNSDWPAVEGLSADLKFEGAGLEIVGRQATSAGMALSKVEARIDDFSAPSIPLRIHGEAQGSIAGFTRFLDESPLGEILGHFYRDIKISGDGRLKLALAIPLDHPDRAKVKGEFAIAGGQVDIDPMLPPVTKLSGSVGFTERRAQAEAMAGSFFGRPLAVSLRADSREVRVAATGEAGVDALRAFYGVGGAASLGRVAPLLDHLSGSLPLKAGVSVKNGRVRVGVESSLQGLASDLPAPLAKSAERHLPVRFQLTPLASDRQRGERRDQFSVEVGKLGGASLIRRGASTLPPGKDPATPEGAADDASAVAPRGPRIERGVLVLADNLPVPSASEPGLRVMVRQSAIDLDAWRSVLAAPSGAGGEPASAGTGGLEWPVPSFDIEARSVRLIGRQWHEVKLSARPRKGAAGDLGGRIEARDMAGDWSWESAGKGTFRARLSQLVLPEDENGVAKPEAPVDPAADATLLRPAVQAKSRTESPDSLPALDVVADNFQLGKRSLGKLELLAENEANLWKVSRLSLTNPDGKVNATGRWLLGDHQRLAQTEVEFALEASDLGRLLGRFGYADAIRQGKGGVDGQLSWRGSPLKLDPPSLGGKLRIKVEKGQFNKLDPGFGKLLSLLSLQTLPRRIALDFRDVFSEGFAFDSISGNTQIAEGVLRTQDLAIEGAPAKVLMQGEVDLGRETQNLRVNIQPEVGGAVALGAAVVVNPVVGVATLLAQKALRDPLNKAFAFEYRITGSLADPKVEKVDRAGKGAAPAPGEAAPGAPAAESAPEKAAAEKPASETPVAEKP